MKFKLLVIQLVFLLLVSCVKHDGSELTFKPISEFSGRLLVMDKTHRFQVEVDWKGDENQGSLRLTHGLSGRIVDINWKNKKMVWHDNAQSTTWQPLSEKGLFDMGVILPPWTLARVFSGKMPQAMKTKDNRNWKGHWGLFDLSIRWASQQQRVELMDIRAGRKAVVIFND